MTNIPKDPVKALATKSLIQKLILQRVVMQVPPEELQQGFYSQVFLVWKRSGKFLHTFNYKASKQISPFRKNSGGLCLFSQKSLDLELLHGINGPKRSISPYSFSISEILRLALRILHLQLRALPFGLSSAPHVYKCVGRSPSSSSSLGLL